MSVPVTVVIPHLPERDSLFQNYFLPSIEANQPEEIIIETERGNANEKRNRGALKVKTPYLFFCDDDVLLSRHALKKMVEVLEEAPRAGYVYSDFYQVAHPVYQPFVLHRAGEFEETRLKENNFISTMSLIRTEIFPGFDPDIERLQDWDIWLTLLKKGFRGTYLPEPLFIAFFIQEQKITASDEKLLFKAVDLIRRKHKLPSVDAIQGDRLLFLKKLVRTLFLKFGLSIQRVNKVE